MKNSDILLSEQYNNYPYPKPIENIDNEIIKKGKIPLADPNFSWHLLWPECKYNNKNLKILVAGCGTHQAAIIARLNPQNFVTGVDISKKSIEHEEKLKKLHKLHNLELINQDFRKLKFNEKFDYIISTGVIHHLEKPETALKFFKQYLNKNGVIYLMVYGNKQRYALNNVIQILKKLKFKQDEKSIISTRQIINNLNELHPAKKFALKATDMNSRSGIVDLMLNYKEHHFNIDKLIKIIENENLFIKNYVDGSINSLSKFFLNDIKMIKKLRKVKKINKLKIGQILNWNDTKIIIIITKNKNNIIKDFNKINLKNCFFYHNRSISFEVGKDFININEKKTSNIYKINFNKTINIDWKLLLTGQCNLNDIISNNPSSLKKEILNLFEILAENNFVDISNYKITNYYNYLPSI